MDDVVSRIFAACARVVRAAHEDDAHDFPDLDLALAALKSVRGRQILRRYPTF